MLRLALLRAAAGFDQQSPLVKQLPIAVLFVVAVVLSEIIPSLVVSDAGARGWGVVIIAVATIAAAVLGRRPDLARFATIIPAVDFIALGVLRFSTGETRSIFASLVVLPVIWFAAKDGRRYIGWAVLGVLVTLLVPFFLGTSIVENVNELTRGVFSSLVFAVVAFIVNELSREARSQISLAEEREHLAAERDRASKAELERASEVQQALLPKTRLLLDGYEFAGVCIPSRDVGGDFYDWYPIEDGAGITLCDVMGKGVGAGIIAATARAVVRSARYQADPTLALDRTTDCLTTDLSDIGSFATMFHARLRRSDGRLSFADAGHGLTILVSKSGEWERLRSDGIPLGISIDDSWVAHERFMKPGDTLVTFSDGVLDLYDGSLKAVDEVAVLVAQAESANDVIVAVADIAREQQNDDDVTVLAVKRWL